MTQTQREQLLGLISRENLVSYNFAEHVAVDYDPGEMWDLFRKLQLSQAVAGSFSPPGPDLSPLERIAYLKAYTVVAVEGIYKRYKGLPDVGPGEFQRDYLAVVVMRMKAFYEENLAERIFKRHPQRPRTAYECESFRRYLLTMAGRIIQTNGRKDLKAWLGRQGISFARYTRALSKALVTGTADSLNLADLADPDAAAIMHASFDAVEEFCSATYYSERIEYLDDKALVIPSEFHDGIERTSEFDRIVHRFGLKDPGSMQSLCEHFELNLVKEVNSENLWLVRYFPQEMIKVKNIFHAIDKGAVLTKTGKEFLLMQYLLIALVVYKKKGYSTQIDEKNQRIFLNSDQIIFLTKVVCDGYRYFLKPKNMRKIVDIVASEGHEQEEVFTALREYFSYRVYDLAEEEDTKSAVPQALLSTAVTDDNVPGRNLDLEEWFRDHAHFAEYTVRLRYLLSGQDPFRSSSELAITMRATSIGHLRIFVCLLLRIIGYRVFESNGRTDTIYFEGSIRNITDQRVLASKQSFQVVKRSLVMCAEPLTPASLKAIAVAERKAGIRRTSILSLANVALTRDLVDVARRQWIELKTLDTFAETVMKSLGALTPEEQRGLREGITKMLLDD